MIIHRAGISIPASEYGSRFGKKKVPAVSRRRGKYFKKEVQDYAEKRRKDSRYRG